MSAPSSIRSRRTFWPCGPVWCVTSCMPRICFARARTSSSDLATFTPPPLPRPPAWICAFTTQTLPPSFFAAASASSTLKQANPRGVGTPYLRKISLPWYSWIFMRPPSPSARTTPGTTAAPSRRWYPWRGSDRAGTVSCPARDLHASPRQSSGSRPWAARRASR